MDARDTRLESTQTAIDVDLGMTLADFLTREDLHKQFTALAWKLATLICCLATALVAATFFIAKHA